MPVNHDLPSQPQARDNAPARITEPVPASVTSIQPGGGFCMTCELAWGRLRRWYLRRFRRGYVQRMRACRRGGQGNYPHDILDPRDLKFYRNQGDIHWDAADDPFRGRDALPVARVGLAEIVLIGGSLLGVAALVGWLYWPLAPLPLALALFIVAFFRNPSRQVPPQPGLVVSPADGRVFAIREVAHDDDFGGPAVVIDIFLSVFNVHLNRVPVACRVLGIRYRPGKFLNALRPEAARENESLELRLETTAPPRRPMRVRQITGAIARRIVCWAKPGDDLPRGGQFGMIKLGSRTELTLPQEPGLDVRVCIGDKVRAGSTIMACYRTDQPSSDYEPPTPAR